MKQTVKIGDKFNRLLAIELTIPSKYGRTRFKWKCDCGNIKTIEASIVKHNRIKSCGCLQKEFASKRFFKGEGIAGFNYVKKQYKRHSNENNREFNLLDEEFKKLILDLCHYCKTPPSNQWTNKTNKDVIFKYNGIDRIDNSQGYIINNVITCCHNCNWMKRDLSYTDFLNHIKKIAKAKGWIDA